jgi:S-disulfanyl-L-cysteine oxidoreductase SoxD
MRKLEGGRQFATRMTAARGLGRLRWIGLLSLGPLVLFPLAAQQRLFQSIWAEIYKSAWVGIYTKNQAARGESAYREHCAFCHGVSLEGTADAPPLAGLDFREDWDGANIADLFEKIQFTMPPKRPSPLSDQQSADILAYILELNGFPAGARALSPMADDLRGVRFVSSPTR